MKISRSIPLEHPQDIHISEASDSSVLKDFDHVLLLLHGFQLDGSFMFKRFEKKFGPKTLIVAPNAPFLVPLLKQKEKEKEKEKAYEKEWLPRYGWYFYDSLKKKFVIDYEPASQWLKALMKDLNPEKKETTILGYSQGGYLAPKAAELIKETTQVIGVNCVFRSNHFEMRQGVRYEQVHGKQDSIVSLEEAKEEFLKMRDAGAEGEFLEVESDHLLNHKLVEASLSLSRVWQIQGASFKTP